MKKISYSRVIGQHNATIIEGVEYKPCLFNNGKGGYHVQYVNVKNIGGKDERL
jgi:hypothetical protein